MVLLSDEETEWAQRTVERLGYGLRTLSDERCVFVSGIELHVFYLVILNIRFGIYSQFVLRHYTAIRPFLGFGIYVHLFGGLLG